MSLQDDIDRERANAKEMIPAEIFAEMEKANIVLAVSGIESESIGEGDRMPDFALPNAKGELVNLTDLLKEGPLVISFYRGGWCPYCNLELRALQQSLQEIKDLVDTNTSKTTNATHSGDVSGATTLTVEPAAITGKPAISSGLVGSDELLLSDSGTLKKLAVSVMNAMKAIVYTKYELTCPHKGYRSLS